jgi:hypothetical protein
MALILSYCLNSQYYKLATKLLVDSMEFDPNEHSQQTIANAIRIRNKSFRIL